MQLKLVKARLKHGQLLLGAVMFAACSSSSDSNPADVGIPPADAGPEASAPDTSPDSSADVAVGSCSLVTPQLGSGTDIDELVNNPARCGQPAHAWLSSPRLGEISDTQNGEQVPAGLSRVRLGLLGVDLPEQLHDVVFEQIAYVTQDRGSLIEATALLSYPTDHTTRTSLDVIVVLHGTAGFTDSCAPSAEPDSQQIVAALASLGYVVVAPDYIGLHALATPTGFLHPYLAGQPTAIASLDAVRAAARRLVQVDQQTCASTRFVPIGGSQGGHAALWIDRLAPYYAAELELAGVVTTVPPSDLYGHTVRALREKVSATANVVALYGATSEWYGARDRLDEVFVPPWDNDIPAALEQSCDPDLPDLELLDLFQPALLAAAALDVGGLDQLSPWGCIATENGLTTTSIKRLPPTAAGYGILFVLGENDTLVDPAIERTSFDTLCAQGLKMQYLECAGASHTKATTWALPEIVAFTADRFAGKPMPADEVCKRTAASSCRGTP